MTSYSLWASGTPGGTPENTVLTTGTTIVLAVPGTIIARFYSGPGASGLPTAIAVWTDPGGVLVDSNTSPSWSGAAASGIVQAAYSGGGIVSAGTYRVGVYGSASGWYAEDDNYWSTGSGSAGITNGPLSSPGGGGSAAQGWYATGGSIAFPSSQFNSYNGWADVVFTPSGPGADEPLSAQVSPTWRSAYRHRAVLLGDAPNNISASVTGAVSPLALAAPAGTVTASSAVTGAVSQLALAAPAGSVASSPSVTGAVSAIALAAPAGAASTFTPDEPTAAQVSRTWRKAYAPNLGRVAEYGDPTPVSAAVTGTTAALSLAAPAGAVVSGTVVSGTVSALALAAPAGSVSASPSVAGATPGLALAAPAGSLAVSSSVSGTVAALALAAPPGTAGTAPTAQQGTVAIANTLAGSVSISNQLAGSVSIVNDL